MTQDYFNTTVEEIKFSGEKNWRSYFRTSYIKIFATALYTVKDLFKIFLFYITFITGINRKGHI